MAARLRFVLRNAEHDVEIWILGHVEQLALAASLQLPPAVAGACARCEEADNLETHVLSYSRRMQRYTRPALRPRTSSIVVGSSPLRRLNVCVIALLGAAP